MIGSSEKPEYLFVLSAKSGSFDGEKLTLTGVPSVLYFSDRPYRVAGHTTLEKFVEAWSKGSDSFKADPPNATLSMATQKGDKNIVIEISNPEIEGDGVRFKVRVLKGSIPNSFGPYSLFIDDECLTASCI